jgi:hypothetical protein
MGNRPSADGIPHNNPDGNEKMDTIKIELKPADTWVRRPCTVCGGYTEKVSFRAENESLGIRVCETCLEDGRIDERLEEHIAELEVRASWLRGLVGRLQVPSYADWQTACAEADELYLRENLGEDEYNAWEAEQQTAAS